MPEAIKTETTSINDVLIAKLEMNQDDRGVFTEVFRKTWYDRPEPVQWNIVRSFPGTFRGFHVHLRHHDYLTIADGKAKFYLKDLRKTSSTFLNEEEITISASEMKMLLIPPGVAHAFYFKEPTIHVYAVTHYWDLDDELGFNYCDPEIKFQLDHYKLNVSDRDQELGSLKDLLQILATKF